MTGTTPEQMRALAADLSNGAAVNEGLWPTEADSVEQAVAALRTAADQLEALHTLLSQSTPSAEPMSTEQIGQEYLRLITTPPSIADIAPGTVRQVVLPNRGYWPVVDPSTIRDVTPPESPHAN